MISRLVLLGATGDLAGRFLLPALARLAAAGALPDDLQVLGAAHDDGDDDTFARHVGARLAAHADDVPEEARTGLLTRLRYRRVDLEDPAGLARAVTATASPDGTASAPVAVYLALPPRLFPAALRALEAAALPPGSRVVVEKPFGESRESAVALDALLARVTGSGAVTAFRVDHALGMPAARHLLALRSPGGALADVWDSRSLEQVDVLWEETLALEGRADFYDRTGALKDVLQNHLLQVLTLVAMELPASPAESALHDARLALLRAVRPPSPAELPSRTRRARYTAGRLAGSGGGPEGVVRGYAEEDGVDSSRGTETYAELALEVDAPRWAGTRFVLRAGKALAAHRKGVLLHFRDGAAPPAGPGTGVPADGGLWLEFDGPTTAGAERSAYEAVLTDVLAGSTALSVSAEEAEASWGVVDPVLQGWADGAVPLLEYAAGSPGPPERGGD